MIIVKPLLLNKVQYVRSNVEENKSKSALSLVANERFVTWKHVVGYSFFKSPDPTFFRTYVTLTPLRIILNICTKLLWAWAVVFCDQFCKWGNVASPGSRPYDPTWYRGCVHETITIAIKSLWSIILSTYEWTHHESEHYLYPIKFIPHYPSL